MRTRVEDGKVELDRLGEGRHLTIRPVARPRQRVSKLPGSRRRRSPVWPRLPGHSMMRRPPPSLGRSTDSAHRGHGAGVGSGLDHNDLLDPSALRPR